MCQSGTGSCGCGIPGRRVPPSLRARGALPAVGEGSAAGARRGGRSRAAVRPRLTSSSSRGTPGGTTPSCDRGARAGDRGRSGGAGGGRGLAVPGRCGGGSPSLSSSEAGIPSRGGQEPRPVPAASPGAGAALQGRRGRGGQRKTHGSVDCSETSVGNNSCGLEAARCWVRGALGAQARKRSVPLRLSIPRGPEQRGSTRRLLQMLIAPGFLYKTRVLSLALPFIIS